MMQFKAFKPQAMNKIAQAMGYQGDMGQFQQFIEQDPARQQQMNMYTNAAQKMAQGGMVKKMAVGGTTTNPSGTQAPTPTITGPSINPTTGDPENIGEFSVEQVYTPGVPVGGTTIAAQTQQTAAQDITQGTGTLTGQVAVPTATAAASQAPSVSNTVCH
jgi:hypothetical protein